MTPESTLIKYEQCEQLFKIGAIGFSYYFSYMHTYY